MSRSLIRTAVVLVVCLGIALVVILATDPGPAAVRTTVAGPIGVRACPIGATPEECGPPPDPARPMAPAWVIALAVAAGLAVSGAWAVRDRRRS